MLASDGRQPPDSLDFPVLSECVRERTRRQNGKTTIGVADAGLSERRRHRASPIFCSFWGLGCPKRFRKKWRRNRFSLENN